MPPSPTLHAANTALLTEGRLDRIAEFFAPGYIAHTTGRPLRGHRAIRAWIRAIRTAFPDLRVTVEILATDGNRVAWQRTFRATHRAAFRGFPATNRRLAWRDMIVSRFHRGRIAEDWVVSDLAEQLLLARKRRPPL